MSNTTKTSENQTPTTSTPQTKPTWKNCNNCELICVDRKEDYKRTKYGRRGTHKNIPEGHKVADIQQKFIYDPEKPTTIPGIIAEEISEFGNKKFIPNVEYDKDQIYDMTGCVLWGVSERTDDTIQVTYVAYDHHNEPIETRKFRLILSLSTS